MSLRPHVARTTKSFILIIAIFAALAGCSLSLSPGSAAEIDAYLSQLSRRREFSGAVLIASDGEILLSEGYGMADYEDNVENTPQTRFRIHWVTMPFTATAVIMLQAEGIIDVEDSICKYIPECPSFWQGISIHHLLTHTSGVSDWVQPWDEISGTPSTSLQLVEQIKGQPPYFEPGEEFRYSNNGYIVLGYIIEKASGMSYETFLQ